MLNLQDTYTHIHDLTLSTLKRICLDYHCTINDHDLSIILTILKNNTYALVSSHYHPALYNEIEKKTNSDVCLQFKPIIQDAILILV